jgi:hypothetical protein
MGLVIWTFKILENYSVWIFKNLVMGGYEVGARV